MARWSGADPLVRVLRSISILALLGLLSLVVADRSRQNDWPLVALLVGAVVLQLGYDVALRIPGILEPRKNGDRDEHD